MGPMEIQSLGLRRAKGTVVAAWCPRNILIETEQKNLIYATVANQKLPSSGSDIEIEGVPETDLFNITLSRAVWRTCDLKPSPPQNPLDTDFTKLLGPYKNRKLNPYFNGRTIRIKGNVIGLESSGEHVGTILISERERILTIDTSMVTGAADGISVGSRIEVTGVCILETENWRPNSLFPPASGYRVVIRNPDDLRIISHPPWWTPKRLLAVIGILLAVLAALSVRMMITRRFNAMITKAKIDAKVGERTRLAVELHDSIAQDLTGIAMKIRSAKRAKDTDAANLDRHLNFAAAVLDSCRDELRNCIWDLRNLTLDDATIDEAIRRTLQQHLGGAKLEIRFAVERKRFSDNTFHTILRIIRELTINAVRHGAATDIKVAGCIDGGNLLISVRDNGCGFDPDNAPGANSGHFGLQGIRERVETLEGKFEIESGKRSRGTKALLRIPLTQNAKEKV
jgi:signal transduction histidine kinase